MATEIFSCPIGLVGNPGFQDSTAWGPLVLASGCFPFMIFKKTFLLKQSNTPTVFGVMQAVLHADLIFYLCPWFIQF